MKTLGYLVLFFLIIQVSSLAQLGEPCLPEGISFTTQEQIDIFKSNYPNCTEIEGDLCIGRWTGTDITNLDGLSDLTSISGNLVVFGNDSLQSLSGLENVIFIGGELWIHDNNGLLSLAAFVNISKTSITNLYVYDNPLLCDCEVQFLCDYLVSPIGTVNIYNNAFGCNAPHEISNSCGNTQPCLPFGNYYFLLQRDVDSFQSNYPGCTKPSGRIYIKGNDIQNLYGLDVVTSINGDLSIYRTACLPYLIGLNNLSRIKGNLSIYGTDFLSSLDGLDNLISIDSGCIIWNNRSLTNLEGLNNLISVGGSFAIMGNDVLESLEGLESLTSVNSLSFQNNEMLHNLSALQHLDTVHGTLRIGFNDTLANLEGLNNIRFVGRDLLVYGNKSLLGFAGLGNLISVGNWVGIWSNESLSSLLGLENLISVGGDLTIGWWHQYPQDPYGNPMLINLDGLSNLQSIGGNLRIEDNDLLSTLAGLDNIESNSIGSLHIHHNDSLSFCETENICNYLVNPGGIVEIYENAPGCNNQEEVEMACNASSVDEVHLSNQVIIHPNPFSTSTTIEFELHQRQKVELKIYNQLGKLIKVIRKNLIPGKQQLVWDAEGLPAGVYFCLLKFNGKIQTAKMIKL